ncbi:histone H3 K4-specific methyltransferase SET7/9 N-terminal domain-containing protein [Aspergillus novofumigatus IBT 16806]|uniref:Histone H3 K4-specific methyltransferase SET7/9 N-terminal domain-containing protein n=1 Tax=Aspergillus novofumigatus (strain IBT 16806) TaxID=1392255 RepID=A0A2I1CPF6_ASPN1|nr:histone H3 K4-specific methyltransferase SET7/9 N-terminal domain-containing protein [Aspergillus novofumigatus IBT 16806]PKX99488.1 histone H3 K4-specific methyltransferase SET7/9 N-terminal domain-containing protein [Aspergillus novofumigatus IBT 16806]
MTGTHVTGLPWTTSANPGKYTGTAIVKPNGSKVPDGQGKIIYNDGESYYEGQWQNGERWFKGAYSCPDYIYDGEWRHDAPNGRGEKQWKNKGIYIGSFVNGKRDGAGSYTLPDGMTINGIYKSNNLVGKFTKRWPNGDYYTGTWDDRTDTGQGYGRLHKSKGQIYEGDLKDRGIPHGHGKMIYENGKVRRGTWIDGSFQDN